MESMYSVGEHTINSHTIENQKEKILFQTKDTLSHILGRTILPNVSKISQKVVLVGVDGIPYYVSFILKRYNFESGYETENKMLMDAWSMIDTSSSAGILFVSGTMDAPYIQQVMYDKHKDQIFSQQTDDEAKKALKQALMCE